ncbi:MAG: DNA-directed RNA polymerase subunit alpha [uncultured bacterium]|nr:MAG: DNA-directed RNA polymerase subunit alpha [uncultured bacterium]
MFILPETELIKTKSVSTDKSTSVFVIEPLLPGYGMTIGNALRRVLLSSLAGAAITSVKIDGVTHEFSTIKGVKEDVVDLILNLKALKVQLHGDEPTIVKLSKKGPGQVIVKDFTKNSQVEFADPEYVIANLDKTSSLSLEITVEKGRGYIPTERRKDEKPVLGNIAIDAIFTPIKRVHYEVENTRVGGMTNFDKLTIDITTDGTINAMEALSASVNILQDHFNLIATELKEGLPKASTAKKKSALAQKLSAETNVEKPVKTKKIKSVVKTTTKKSNK